MDYEKIYKDFYSEFYTKEEAYIKNVFVEKHSQKRTFSNAIDQANSYISQEFTKKYNLHTNENLENFYQIFNTRHRNYSSDQVEEIFKNEIKTEFDKIKASELPAGYNYNKLIKDIALIEIKNEISRLLTINSQFLEMFHRANTFDDFEIKCYARIILENYPLYKKLYSIIYPDQNTHIIENDVIVAPEENILGAAINGENLYPLLFVNIDVYYCFLEYQKHIIDFYIDYSYLKKRLEIHKLIHYHKDNDFMKIVFEDIKLISKKNYDEYCVQGKLKSLTKSFNIHRQNNFNVVFKGLF